MFDLLRKPKYDHVPPVNRWARMSTLLVSSKGQIVLPAELRRRLGMGAGARVEVLEESDGLKLRVVRSVATADVSQMAGLVRAPARNVPRRLAEFDPAALLNPTLSPSRPFLAHVHRKPLSALTFASSAKCSAIIC